MERKPRSTVIAAVAIAALAASGVAIAGASRDDHETGRPILGQELQRASAAALEQTRGGKVTETEVGGEEGAYEVEITRADGSQVDVHLDADFDVVSAVGDDADAGEDDAAARVAISARPGDELPRGSETVRLDPADFSTDIDNRFWPMRPGSRWVYRETDSDGASQKVVVTVTNKTKLIANGITARVVRDVVTEKGELVEVTDDWYAQDEAGNVWYLGEATTEYENGKPVSTAGSFEAGVDGAQAGVIMPARPRPGLRYRQEYYKGEAEDKASIVSRREQAEVPAGHYRRVLMTRDINPLERKVLEFKFYARGVGPVLALSVSGGSEREELVSFERG